MIREILNSQGKLQKSLSIHFPQLKGIEIKKSIDFFSNKLTLIGELSFKNSEKKQFFFFPIFENKKRFYEKFWKPEIDE
ncbi:hypothetical protein ACFL35_07400 [Candidatus Riflebacteria bacterium]